MDVHECPESDCDAWFLTEEALKGHMPQHSDRPNANGVAN